MCQLRRLSLGLSGRGPTVCIPEYGKGLLRTSRKAVSGNYFPFLKLFQGISCNKSFCFFSGGTDTTLDDKTRFPTLLRLSPYQQRQLVDVTASLFTKFQWQDIALICDEGATELNTFALICKALPNSLRQTQGISTVNVYQYNFKTNPDHKRTLLEAARYSRGCPAFHLESSFSLFYNKHVCSFCNQHPWISITSDTGK